MEWLRIHEFKIFSAGMTFFFFLIYRDVECVQMCAIFIWGTYTVKKNKKKLENKGVNCCNRAGIFVRLGYEKNGFAGGSGPRDPGWTLCQNPWGLGLDTPALMVFKRVLFWFAQIPRQKARPATSVSLVTFQHCWIKQSCLDRICLFLLHRKCLGCKRCKHHMFRVFFGAP